MISQFKNLGFCTLEDRLKWLAENTRYKVTCFNDTILHIHHSGEILRVENGSGNGWMRGKFIDIDNMRVRENLLMYVDICTTQDFKPRKDLLVKDIVIFDNK